MNLVGHNKGSQAGEAEAAGGIVNILLVDNISQKATRLQRFLANTGSIKLAMMFERCWLLSGLRAVLLCTCNVISVPSAKAVKCRFVSRFGCSHRSAHWLQKVMIEHEARFVSRQGFLDFFNPMNWFHSNFDIGLCTCTYYVIGCTNVFQTLFLWILFWSHILHHIDDWRPQIVSRWSLSVTRMCHFIIKMSGFCVSLFWH